jgi:hypothetical protein
MFISKSISVYPDASNEVKRLRRIIFLSILINSFVIAEAKVLSPNCPKVDQLIQDPEVLIFSAETPYIDHESPPNNPTKGIRVKKLITEMGLERYFRNQLRGPKNSPRLMYMKVKNVWRGDLPSEVASVFLNYKRLGSFVRIDPPHSHDSLSIIFAKKVPNAKWRGKGKFVKVLGCKLTKKLDENFEFVEKLNKEFRKSHYARDISEHKDRLRTRALYSRYVRSYIPVGLSMGNTSFGLEISALIGPKSALVRWGTFTMLSPLIGGVAGIFSNNVYYFEWEYLQHLLSGAAGRSFGKSLMLTYSSGMRVNGGEIVGRQNTYSITGVYYFFPTPIFYIREIKESKTPKFWEFGIMVKAPLTVWGPFWGWLF